jgi:hypothetical protein
MAHIEKRDEEERRRIRDRQNQEAEEDIMGPEYVVHTRATDFSFWVRVGYLLDKYKLLVYLVFMGLIAFGFDFKTPAQNNKLLSMRIDSMAVALRKQDAERAMTNRKLDVLITLACMQQKPRDMQLAQVDCTKFIVLTPDPNQP